MARVAPLSLEAPSALQPGEYTVADREVHYCCPRCSTNDTLSDYAISSDGKVTPPWGCSRRGCAAADWLQLGDYDIAACAR